MREPPMQADATATNADRSSTTETARRLPMCYFCSSTDTMEPFRRDRHVFLLSTLMPRLGWRYCRHCGHHFLTFWRDPHLA